MYVRHLAVLVLGGFQLALGAVAHEPHHRRGVTPSYPSDEKTTKYCSWWHDYDDKISCNDLLGDHQIDIEQFKRWNPSIGGECKGLTVGRSYCVEALLEPGNNPEPELEPSPTEKPEPSPTTPSNGIKTPNPIQPGMVSNCNKFYLVKKGDSCAGIASKHDITLAEFSKWNAGTGSNCVGLWADAYACVSIIGYKPSPTKSQPKTTSKPSPTVPSNGIRTPSPIQSRMHKNCNKFYLVKSTATCASISDRYKVPLNDFYSWNPSVGSTCQALLADYYVCVSVVGWKPPTPSPTKPSTPSNGISTPSPVQAGMTKNCNKFALIKKATTCASIQDRYKITMAQLAKWNPAIGSKCTGLWADYYVCVGVIGQAPAPTQPPKSNPTPTPVQAGMVKNCKKFALVKKSTTCASIQDHYKITMAQLAKWNPAIGSKCTALWANYYVCVGV